MIYSKWERTKKNQGTERNSEWEHTKTQCEIFGGKNYVCEIKVLCENKWRKSKWRKIIIFGGISMHTHIKWKRFQPRESFSIALHLFCYFHFVVTFLSFLLFFCNRSCYVNWVDNWCKIQTFDRTKSEIRRFHSTSETAWSFFSHCPVKWTNSIVCFRTSKTNSNCFAHKTENYFNSAHWAPPRSERRIGEAKRSSPKGKLLFFAVNVFTCILLNINSISHWISDSKCRKRVRNIEKKKLEPTILPGQRSGWKGKRNRNRMWAGKKEEEEEEATEKAARKTWWKKRATSEHNILLLFFRARDFRSGSSSEWKILIKRKTTKAKANR